MWDLWIDREGKNAKQRNPHKILFLNTVTLGHTPHTQPQQKRRTHTDKNMYCNSDYDNNSSYGIFWRNMQIYPRSSWKRSSLGETERKGMCASGECVCLWNRNVRLENGWEADVGRKKEGSPKFQHWLAFKDTYTYYCITLIRRRDETRNEMCGLIDADDKKEIQWKISV